MHIKRITQTVDASEKCVYLQCVTPIWDIAYLLNILIQLYYLSHKSAYVRVRCLFVLLLMSKYMS